MNYRLVTNIYKYITYFLQMSDTINIDNAYFILGIVKDATMEEIKIAYKKKALRWHPDKNPLYAEKAERKMKQINMSYEVLLEQKEKEQEQQSQQSQPQQSQQPNQPSQQSQQPSQQSQQPSQQQSQQPSQQQQIFTWSIQEEDFWKNNWASDKFRINKKGGITSLEEINLIVTMRYAISFLNMQKSHLQSVNMQNMLLYYYEIKHLKMIANIWFGYQDIEQGKTKFIKTLVTNKPFFVDIIRDNNNNTFINSKFIYYYLNTRKQELSTMKNINSKFIKICKCEYFIIQNILSII